jgi:opacity protein-like surface antigen
LFPVGVSRSEGRLHYTASINATNGGVCACDLISGAVAMSPTGFVVGAGAEWKIWPDVVVGVEYLHYMLESDTVIPIGQRPLNPLVGLGDHVHTNNVDAVRLRASWLFTSGL